MKRTLAVTIIILILTTPAWSWYDKTHIAIAKAAGYEKWYNAAGADITKIKAGAVEKRNHYVNNPPDTIVTSKMVLDQVDHYNKSYDLTGHL
jgi:hypothetical protein